LGYRERMKKTFIFLMFGILVTTSLFAQFRKGAWMVGRSGGIGMTKHRTSSPDPTSVAKADYSYNVMPQVNYFVRDNLALGVGIDYAVNHGDAAHIAYDYKAVLISPQARYYYQRFYGQGTFEAGICKGAELYLGNDIVANEVRKKTAASFAWSLGIGYTMFLNKFVALEPQISYEHYSHQGFGNRQSESGPYVKLGFQVFINRRD
jgi:hypothetical protein